LQVAVEKRKKMKNKLFILLIVAMVLMCVSFLLRNIYLLGIAEIIIIPTMVMLIKLNLTSKTN